MRAVGQSPWLVLVVSVAVFLLHALLPALVLSVARKPWTYFAFNPWLKSLPTYLTSPAPLAEKLDFLSRVAVFWFSADGDYGAPEWGFAVDTLDLLRFAVVSLLVGTYFALWRYCRAHPGAAWRGRLQGSGGVLGAAAGALGLTTGPCSVMGCGAPVLPAVGLVFAGLSSTTLSALSYFSRVSGVVVLVALVTAVGALGWRAGRDVQTFRRVAP
jgi:hypothetical protein